MRIIIELDNQSVQPSVQVSDTSHNMVDSAITNSVKANAIDAGIANYGFSNNEENSSQTSSNPSFESMKENGISAGAAPSF